MMKTIFQLLLLILVSTATHGQTLIRLSQIEPIQGTVIKSQGEASGKVLTTNGTNGATWQTPVTGTILNGTGFVKASGTSISYDNSTYVTTNTTQTITGLKTLSNTSTIFGNYTSASGITIKSLTYPSVSFSTEAGSRVLYWDNNDLVWRYDGTNNAKVFHAGNSNLSTVNWSVANATLSTHAMAYGQFIGAVSGTLNYIPKFTGTNTIGNSLIYDDGTNVGIGTSTPSSLLQVKKDQSATTELIVENANTGTAALSRISLKNGTTGNDALSVGAFGTGFSTTGGYVQDGAYVFSENALTGGLSIGTRAGLGNLRFYTGGQADANMRMIINYLGNISVGGTSNSFNSKFEIVGSSSAPANSFFLTTTTWTSTSAGSAIRIGHGANSGNTYGAIDNLISGGLAFGNLVLQGGGGNVGIGTTTPGEKLEVNGSAKINGTVIGKSTQALTETSGAVSWNYLNGSSASVTIDEPTVITLSNVPEGATGNIYIVQGDSGDDNITFVHTGLMVKWRGDDTDLTDAAGSYDVVSFWRAGSILFVTLGSDYINQ